MAPATSGPASSGRSDAPSAVPTTADDAAGDGEAADATNVDRTLDGGEDVSEDTADVPVLDRLPAVLGRSDRARLLREDVVRAIQQQGERIRRGEGT